MFLAVNSTGTAIHVGGDAGSGHNRFTVEEVPNYEPVLFTTSKAMLVKTASNEHRQLDFTDSPALPKRHPVMKKELINSGNSVPQINITSEEAAATAAATTAATAAASDDDDVSVHGDVKRIDDSEDEDEATSPRPPTSDNASSAFDNATFYV
jgi:hypothetical protein